MELSQDGNRRAGYFVAGSVLLLAGLGGAILLNLLLHAIAPASGFDLYFFRVYPGWSAYATVAAGIGLLATLVGSGMFYLGWTTPRGKLYLFDTEGRHPPDPEQP
jgi:hypothetical protein